MAARLPRAVGEERDQAPDACAQLLQSRSTPAPAMAPAASWHRRVAVGLGDQARRDRARARPARGPAPAATFPDRAPYSRSGKQGAGWGTWTRAIGQKSLKGASPARRAARHPSDHRPKPRHDLPSLRRPGPAAASPSRRGEALLLDVLPGSMACHPAGSSPRSCSSTWPWLPCAECRRGASGRSGAILPPVLRRWPVRSSRGVGDQLDHALPAGRPDRGQAASRLRRPATHERTMRACLVGQTK
jgi:hypothetical protein